MEKDVCFSKMFIGGKYTNEEFLMEMSKLAEEILKEARNPVEKASKEFARMIQDRAKKEGLTPRAIALSILNRFK